MEDLTEALFLFSRNVLAPRYSCHLVYDDNSYCENLNNKVCDAYMEM